MSDSDKRDPEDDTGAGEAEPVDAEFEPAPGNADADPAEAEPGDTASRSGGGGGVKLVLFVILAAAVGGAAGFALSRYLPTQSVPGLPEGERAALEDRLAALEADAGAAGAGEAVSRIEARVAELEQVVESRAGLGDEVSALADTVRRLQSRTPTGDAAQAGGGRGPAPDFAELERRLSDAFGRVDSRLDAIEGDLETVRGEADQARSAAQQASTAIAAMGAPQDGEAAGGADPARLNALAGRVEGIEGALDEIREETGRLQPLTRQVEQLAQELEAQAGASGQAPDLSGLRGRLEDLEQRVDRLAAEVEALPSAAGAAAETTEPASAPGDLAARALAYAALSEAASGSQSYAVELEALSRVWPGAPGLDRLRAHAREGAPTPDQLEDAFPGEALRQATGETRVYFGVLRVGRTEDAGPAAAIEAALAEDDLAEAARIAAGLDQTGRAAVDDWLAGLEARLQVRQALSQQGAALAAAGDRE